MFDSVVLALDGSESSDRALECATALAKAHSSSVRVVHAVELSVGRGGGLRHSTKRRYRRRSRARLRLSRQPVSRSSSRCTRCQPAVLHMRSQTSLRAQRPTSSSRAPADIRGLSACCSGASRSACCTSHTARFSSFRCLPESSMGEARGANHQSAGGLPQSPVELAEGRDAGRQRRDPKPGAGSGGGWRFG